MGIVSNNIANVNSTAFKKSKTNFEHIYSRDRSSSPSKFSGQGWVLMIHFTNESRISKDN